MGERQGIPNNDKWCPGCKIYKAAEDFYPHPKVNDGRSTKCRACTRQRVKSYRLSNSEIVRMMDKDRSSEPKRKAARAERVRQFWNDNPQVRVAYNAVSNALRRKAISKNPCLFCGAKKNLQAHHHDYSKPLAVTWFCRRCNRLLHAYLRMRDGHADQIAMEQAA